MIYSNRKGLAPSRDRGKVSLNKPRVYPAFEPGPLGQKYVVLPLALPPSPF